MTNSLEKRLTSFLSAMKHKEAEALRAGTSLSEWLEYEKEMEEASAAGKQTADLSEANAPFLKRGLTNEEGSPWLSSSSRRRSCRTEI